MKMKMQLTYYCCKCDQKKTVIYEYTNDEFNVSAICQSMSCDNTKECTSATLQSMKSLSDNTTKSEGKARLLG